MLSQRTMDTREEKAQKMTLVEMWEERMDRFHGGSDSQKKQVRILRNDDQFWDKKIKSY